MSTDSISCAGEFHNLAYPVIQSMGFKLEIEPSQPHFSGAVRGISRVVYKHMNGLYLVASFNPYDGSSAHLIFGRHWRWGIQAQGYSNNYSCFSHYFGFPLDDFFNFRHKSGQEVYKEMLSSIEESMPYILEHLTLQNLEAIEMIGPYGAGFKNKLMATQNSDNTNISACKL